MRKFLGGRLVLVVGSILIVVALANLGFLTGRSSAAADTVDELHYSYGNNATSVVFDWHGQEQDIYYGSGTNYGQMAVAGNSPITPIDEPGPFREVTISGLQAGTTYHYKVGTNGLDHTFSTEPTGSYTSVDIGDTMSSYCAPSYMPQMQALIAAQKPDFVTHGGDIAIANQCGTPAIHSFYTDIEVWSHDAAFQVALGNHEYGQPTTDPPAPVGTPADTLANYKGRDRLSNAQTVPGDTATTLKHPGCGAEIGSKTNTCMGDDWGYFTAGHVLYIEYPEPDTPTSMPSWEAKASTLMAQAQADPNIDFIVTNGHRTAFTDSGTGAVQATHDALVALSEIYSPYVGNTYGLNGKYVMNIQHDAHNFEAFAPSAAKHGLTYITDAAGGQGFTNWVSPIDPDSVYRLRHFGVLVTKYDATAHTMNASFVCGSNYTSIKDTCTYGQTMWSTSFTAANIVTPPPDTTPPVVALSSPTDGSSQSGTITLSADASDNVGVTNVSFYVDGTLLASGTASPYTASLDTTTLTNSDHVITAVASDAAGNTTTSLPATITINNVAPPPAVPVLTTSLSDGVSTPAVGDQLMYTAIIQNTASGSTAPGVSLAITLPSDLTITNSNGGTVSGNTVTWSVGDLAGGQQASEQIVATLTAGQPGDSLTATAQTQATDTSCQNTGSNCAATDTDTIATPVINPLALCGNPAPATPVAIKHVVVVMLENNSYKQVIGSSSAPYQTSLSNQCGKATAMFGATHSSAANYLAASAGEYPASSPPGCGSVKACTDSSNNLYHQLDTAGLSWKAYEESMPSACATTTSGNYKIGHNPAIFYSDIPSAECKANDLPVTDLTAQSGAFYADLQNQTLPSLSWVTPGLNNDGEGSGGLGAADTWMKNFIGTVQQSNSYQAGNTVVLFTYDEGSGSDGKTGEDCTNMSLDLPIVNNTSAHQDSCHLPFMVAYPYTPAGTSDSTFFDHYSITKTVEDLFGLPYLAHAADTQTTSLVGHFGIASPGSTPPPVDTTPPSVAISSPSSGSSQSGSITLGANASDNVGVTNVSFYVDGNLLASDAASPYSAALDTTTLSNGSHSLTAVASDAAGNTTTSSAVVITVANGVTPPPSACTVPAAGIQELSGNLSLETNQTGWTGVYNATSAVSRTQPLGGSYDGLWALMVAPKSGSSGTAGVNNAAPIWVPGSPGISTTIGARYTGSAMVRASVAGETVTLLVRETTPSGAGVSYGSVTTTLKDTAWHNLSATYAAKSAGNAIRYSLYATNFANSSQYFLADCMSLQAPAS